MGLKFEFNQLLQLRSNYAW